VDARDAGGIEHTIAGFTGGGLIVTASPSAFLRRELIIAAVARHRLPAVYPIRLYVAKGGLISYGPDEIEQLHLLVAPSIRPTLVPPAGLAHL